MQINPFINKILIVFCFLFSIIISSQSTTYNNSTTITLPTSVTKATVQTWGGGGKGGSKIFAFSSGTTGGAGGGGGGAYSISTLSGLTGSYDVIVGMGSSSTAPGGNSSFTKGGFDLVLSRGGNSASNNTNSGATGGSIGTFIGGNGGNNGLGGGGSSAGTNSNGNNAFDENGAIAPTGGGNGGDGKTSQGNGSDGIYPGGGGGGAFRSGFFSGSRNGGKGANGKVIVCLFPANAGTISGYSTVCQGDSAVSYTIPAISNATSYNWSYSGTGATISGSSNSVNINFSASATSGDLTVYGVNECGDGELATSVITVNTTPTAGYSYVISPLNNGEVTFTNTSTNATSFLWDFDDTNTSTSINPIHTFSANGTYNVKLTSTNSCGSDEETLELIIDNNILGVEDEILNTFSLYPNPVTSDRIKLTLPNEIEDFNITISSILGQELFSNEFRNGYNKIHNIDVANYKSGIYFITVSTSKGKATKRLIIR